MAVFHLVYGSLEAYALPNEEIFKILEQSRRNNARVNVTGLLLFRSPRFLQVLEGDEAAVRATYARIENDPRHSAPQIFLEFTDDEKIFPQWAMGYPEKTGIQKHGEDLFDTISTLLKSASASKEQVIKALKRFNLG